MCEDKNTLEAQLFRRRPDLAGQISSKGICMYVCMRFDLQLTTISEKKNIFKFCLEFPSLFGLTVQT